MLSKIEVIKAGIARLDASQLVSIGDMISALIQKQAIGVILEQRARKMVKEPCVHCGNSFLVRFGKTPSGTPRLKCRFHDCGKTYVATQNSIFRGMYKKAEWVNFMGEMRRHSSILDMEGNLPISHSTILRWRHRILSSFQGNNSLSGVVQVDEKFFRKSFKGDQQGVLDADRFPRIRGGEGVSAGLSHDQVAVLTAVENHGNINQAVIGGRTTANIHAAMKGWLSGGAVLVSDKLSAYKHVAAQLGCLHIKAGESHMNLNRVNAYHNNLEDLINRKCRGVSTKHLSKYLSWARLMTRKQPFGQGMAEMMLA